MGEAAPSSKKAAAGVDKRLFTPGPLLCSPTVKQAMQRDLGSRDVEFIDAVKSVRSELLKVAGVSPVVWTVVPMQGSGTFSVEAVFQTAVSRRGRVKHIRSCPKEFTGCSIYDAPSS